MNGLYTIERARCVLGAARGGRWVLPLVCGLVLAAALALAAEQALVRTLGNDTAELATRAPSATAVLGEASDAAGSHWVTLTYVGPNGRQSRLHCLTTRERLAGDALFADPEDMLKLAFEVCQSMRDEAATASATPSLSSE